MGSLSFTHWTYVWLLLACGIGAAMQVGKVPPTLGLLQRDLHLGLVAGAWVISMFSVVGAPLGCFVGSIVDRMGPRRAATGGLLGIAAASRALEGIAFVMVVVAVPSRLVASWQIDAAVLTRGRALPGLRDLLRAVIFAFYTVQCAGCDGQCRRHPLGECTDRARRCAATPHRRLLSEQVGGCSGYICRHYPRCCGTFWW
jgi:MFS family permease